MIVVQTRCKNKYSGPHRKKIRSLRLRKTTRTMPPLCLKHLELKSLCHCSAQAAGSPQLTPPDTALNKV